MDGTALRSERGFCCSTGIQDVREADPVATAHKYSFLPENLRLHRQYPPLPWRLDILHLQERKFSVGRDILRRVTATVIELHRSTRGLLTMVGMGVKSNMFIIAAVCVVLLRALLQVIVWKEICALNGVEMVRR